MLFNPNHENRLDRLANRLRTAPALTPELFCEIVIETCQRVPALNKAASAGRLDRLITAGAWTDAALALIGLAVPAWKLRRLVCEDGEWFCSLSTQPNLPVTLDETADGSHDVLPLAILSAFLEACRRSSARETNSPIVPQVRPAPSNAVCCDNFA
jgi:hypothetical protein